MIDPLERRRGRRRLHVILAAAAPVMFAGVAPAADNWVGGYPFGVSSWSANSNWSLDTVPTTGGEVVNIVNGIYTTVTYDYTGAAVTLGMVTIDNTLGMADTLSMSANTLTSDFEYLGSIGAAVVNQSGGNNNVTGNNFLYLGYNVGSTGTYQLSGAGTLSVAGRERIGQNGAGIFNQSGGANILSGTGNLDLANQLGSTGTYILSGATSTLSAVGNEYVGDGGVGLFTQMDGTNSLTSSTSVLYLGNSSGSTGTYNLSGGVLQQTGGGSEYVGYGGIGNFNQSGGTNTLTGGSNELVLGYNSGSTGTYTLIGGTLSVPVGIEYIGGQIGLGGATAGIFNQSGGLNSIFGTIYLGANSGSTGTYYLSSTGTLAAAQETLANSGAAFFVQTGGLNSSPSGNPLTIAVSSSGVGTYSLVSGLLSITGYEYIGSSGNGTINQSGGTNSTNSGYPIILGYSAGSTGTYILSASGSLVCGGELIGDGGVGVFNQSGGSNYTNSEDVYSLSLGVSGEGTGTYILSGSGSLSVGGSEFIGFASIGVFNQSGGTNSIAAGGSGELDIGRDSGSNGTYNLSGGVANDSGAVYVGGSSSGSGGTGVLSVSNAGEMVVTGSFTLYNAGSVSAASEYVGGGVAVNASIIVGPGGSGVFNQSGGTNTITGGFLDLAENGTATYILSNGGTLTNTGSPAAGETVGENGYAVFNQSGGLNNIEGYWQNSQGTFSLFVAEHVGSTGTYILSGTGTLSTDYDESIGSIGLGVFNQSGGINTTNAAVYLAYNTGSTGTYALSAGTLSVNGNDSGVGEFVGYSGTGTFNQSGGVNSNDAQLDLGYSSGSTGTYILSSSGFVSANLEVIGSSGVGIFNQSGGGNAAGGPLDLGLDAGSIGTYLLSGASLLEAGGDTEVIGSRGTGSFIQSGGENLAGSVDVAQFSGSTGSYTLSGGTLDDSGAANVGGYTRAGGTGVLTVSNTGTLGVTGTLTVYNAGRVNINGGSATVGGLSISATGIVNVNAALAIDYGSRASDPVGTIFTYLQEGYAGGTWSGTGGIVSTSAAAGTTPILSVGYADGDSDTGTPAQPNQILIMYTLAGDANLDGKVDFTDLGIVGQHLNTTGNDWAHGNFTYSANGTVDFTDLGIVGQDLNKLLTPGGSSGVESGGTIVTLDAPAAAPTLAELQLPAIHSTAVVLPEPSCIALAACGALGLLARRRRKSESAV